MISLPWYVIGILFLLAGAGGAAWIMMYLTRDERRRSEQLWRETLVHLKSASAYEAQDSLDRMHRRQKTPRQLALEKDNEKDEAMSEDPVLDMAEDMRTDLERAYGAQGQN